MTALVPSCEDGKPAAAYCKLVEKRGQSNQDSGSHSGPPLFIGPTCVVLIPQRWYRKMRRVNELMKIATWWRQEVAAIKIQVCEERMALLVLVLTEHRGLVAKYGL